jgi:hypothetical protein
MTISPKKSKPAQNKKRKTKDVGGFNGFEATVETSADQQIAALQNDLTSERDERLEERFWSRSIIIFLILVIAAPNIPTVAWLPIFLIYLVGLTYYAKRSGIDDVVYGLSALLSYFTKDKTDEP